jgi:hypothetical protein
MSRGRGGNSGREGQSVDRRAQRASHVTVWLPVVVVAAVVAFIVWRIAGVTVDTAEVFGPPVASSVQVQVKLLQNRLELARRDAEWLGTLLLGRMSDSTERARLLTQSHLAGLRVRDRDGHRTVLSVNADALPDGEISPGSVTTVSTPTQCLLVIGASDPTGQGREIIAWITPTDELIGRLPVSPTHPGDVAESMLLTVRGDSVHVLSSEGGTFLKTGQSFHRDAAPRFVRFALTNRSGAAVGPLPNGRSAIAAASSVPGTSLHIVRLLENRGTLMASRWRLARDLGIALVLGALGVVAAVTTLRERRTRELESALYEARMQALQQHLRPHFLFNALTAIGELAHTAPARAEAVVLQLSDLLRESLALASDAIVPLERELRLLDAYLAVERERFGDALHVSVEVPASLRSTGVLPWTLQPLIENALKHGQRPCQVEIRAIRENGCVVLQISNRVSDDTRDTAGTGIGLSNLTDRMQAVFGKRGRVSTERDATHFVVTVTVPDEDAAQWVRRTMPAAA